MSKLTEIEERAKKATEGPWLQRMEAWNNYVEIPGCKDSEFASLDDGTFVAHSREDVPYLLSLLRSAEEALESIRVRTSGFADEWASNLSKTASDALSKIREEGGHSK